jgi:hypothetical protein
MIYVRKQIKYLFIIFTFVVLVLSTNPAWAKRTIYGKVTSSNGNPIAGATVKAYDSDTGKDDFMGSAKTDGNGNYKIQYRGGAWDGKKTSHHTQWRPDIYIVIVAPNHKQFRSKKHNNHKLKKDLRINASLKYMGGARTVQGRVFSPSNRPVAGAMVTACDADLGGDQRMGTAVTDNNGNYKIAYRGGAWDGKKTSHHTQWRPDIYVVIAKDDYKKFKSKTYGDHKLKDKLIVNAKLENKPGKTFPKNQDMCNWKKSDAERCKERGKDYIWLGPEGRLGRCTKLRNQVKWLESKYRGMTNLANLGKPHVLAYLTYFQTIGSGSEQRSLPSDFRKMIRRHYGNYVDKIKYASSKHTSTDQTAMTDCYDIYFPAGSGVVAELKNGRIFDGKNARRLHWLLHEIEHSEQCNRWGGRYTYADKWFGQLSGTVLEQIITKRTKISNKSIHNAMPMEANAEKKADKVMQQLGYLYDRKNKEWTKIATPTSPAAPSSPRKRIWPGRTTGGKRRLQ